MSKIKGVIFDLDGVIVSTDEYHFQAWQQLAESEGIAFSREDNERLRGVSRMESLEIILEKASQSYTDEQKEQMATRKNDLYRDLLKNLTPEDILPGVEEVLSGLKERGVKIAIGSSSKNAQPILAAVGLSDAFEVVVDGTHISKSKPDPEVFTKAGQQLGLEPDCCLVVEDADAGAGRGGRLGTCHRHVACRRPHGYLSRSNAHVDLAGLRMLRNPIERVPLPGSGKAKPL